MFINFLVYLFIFILGVCMGSFLNCYIYRLEQGKSMAGRSFCPNCKHPLSWKDLFPIFSFIFLQGKCRYCKDKISIQYPLVELATGILFVLVLGNLATGWSFRFGIFDFITICAMLYALCCMIIIFIYDLKHYIIPDKVLIPAIVVTFLYNIFNSYMVLHNSYFIDSLIAAAIASGFFLIIFLLTKGKGMGFGDVKLAILMGLLLGIFNVLVALFLAFFFGAIIGLMLLAYKKKGLKSEIPFGPFLIAGTLIALLWGNQIVDWYFQFFLIS